MWKTTGVCRCYQYNCWHLKVIINIPEIINLNSGKTGTLPKCVIPRKIRSHSQNHHWLCNDAQYAFESNTCSKSPGSFFFFFPVSDILKDMSLFVLQKHITNIRKKIHLYLGSDSTPTEDSFKASDPWLRQVNGHLSCLSSISRFYHWIK